MAAESRLVNPPSPPSIHCHIRTLHVLLAWTRAAHSCGGKMDRNGSVGRPEAAAGQVGRLASAALCVSVCRRTSTSSTGSGSPGRRSQTNTGPVPSPSAEGTCRHSFYAPSARPKPAAPRVEPWHPCAPAFFEHADSHMNDRAICCAWTQEALKTWQQHNREWEVTIWRRPELEQALKHRLLLPCSTTMHALVHTHTVMRMPPGVRASGRSTATVCSAHFAADIVPSPSPFAGLSGSCSRH